MQTDYKNVHEECTVIDIHCHPTLKMNLFDRKFSEENPPDHPQRSTGFDPFTTQVTLPKMKKGGVDAIFSSIYVPEKGFVENSCTVPIIYPILQQALPKFVAGVEITDKPDSCFKQTQNVLQQFENEVNGIQASGEKVSIAKSYTEFETAIANGDKVILHAVEGAHSLGRNYGHVQPYLDNVESLFNAGVCLLTLGHFFVNDIVSPTFGFPKMLGDMLVLSTPREYYSKLGFVGVKVVERMLEIGMIIDLVHSNPNARHHIFEINDSLGASKRPLVMSHTGVQFYYQKGLNISDTEIRSIQNCEGTIGIILNNYWLKGIEDPALGSTDRKGIEDVVRTVRHIKAVTGTYDNISIGSDYDGFTDPPDDIPDYNAIPLITKALLERGENNTTGMSVSDIRKVMGENAMRVLKKGWGK